MNLFKQQLNKEPIIEVKIKPRAKEHSSNNFKLLVRYQINLTEHEKYEL
jgi:hypothetical protein